MTPPDDQDRKKPDALSKASSELNNLLQIISGSSAELENFCQGGSEKYLQMLRQSIERAEIVASELSYQAGGQKQKMILHPELASFAKQKKITQLAAPRPQILVVDDEEDVLILVKQILTVAGYNVTTAQSGFECLDLFRRKPLDYQLVLIDLTMPFMDGEETFSRLREIREDIPVVLCTGFIQNERLQQMMKGGLAGFLRKPIAPDEIVTSIRSILDSVRYGRVSTAYSGGAPGMPS